MISASDLQIRRSRVSPALTTTWIYLDLFLGSLEFKSSATLVKSQLVCFQSVGILKKVMLNLNAFVSVVCSAPLAFVI